MMKDGVADTHPALVGRQHEMAVLWSRFEESTAGRLQVALVVGEPGIGKTRLLQEVARRAEERGATVLYGGASEAEGMPPYLPFLEALGQHIRVATPGEVREQTGVMASVLGAILPELSLRLGELPPKLPVAARTGAPAPLRSHWDVSGSCRRPPCIIARA